MTRSERPSNSLVSRLESSSAASGLPSDMRRTLTASWKSLSSFLDLTRSDTDSKVSRELWRTFARESHAEYAEGPVVRLVHSTGDHLSALVRLHFRINKRHVRTDERRSWVSRQPALFRLAHRREAGGRSEGREEGEQAVPDLPDGAQQAAVSDPGRARVVSSEESTAGRAAEGDHDGGRRFPQAGPAGVRPAGHGLQLPALQIGSAADRLDLPHQRAGLGRVQPLRAIPEGLLDRPAEHGAGDRARERPADHARSAELLQVEERLRAEVQEQVRRVRLRPNRR